MDNGPHEMICILCPKVAWYQVPRTEKYYCEDHQSAAVLECRKQLHERDMPHYMERVGIFAQTQELRLL
jgi:hypothetical protein